MYIYWINDKILLMCLKSNTRKMAHKESMFGTSLGYSKNWMLENVYN